MKALVLVLGLAACGKVALAPDANTDAPLKDALACNADETVCSGACVATQTDNDNCGGCGLACSDSSTCTAGHCINHSGSCSTIHAFDSTMPSGPYTLLGGVEVFCDMDTTDDNARQYEGLYYAVFNNVTAGYTIVSAANLQNATMQKAFIYLYNKQHGLNLLAGFTNVNCCLKQSTTADATFLALKGGNVFLATTADAQSCNLNAPSQAHFQINGNGGIYSGMTLADTFFTTNPASTVAGCSDNANAAMFWKRH
ncbi:MAG: hypothetical protein QM831_19330 [Kofleriaceae bacterium]